MDYFRHDHIASRPAVQPHGHRSIAGIQTSLATSRTTKSDVADLPEPFARLRRRLEAINKHKPVVQYLFF